MGARGVARRGERDLVLRSREPGRIVDHSRVAALRGDHFTEFLQRGSAQDAGGEFGSGFRAGRVLLGVSREAEERAKQRQHDDHAVVGEETGKIDEMLMRAAGPVASRAMKRRLRK